MSTEITTLGVKVTQKGSAKAKKEINSIGVAGNKARKEIGLLSGTLAALSVGLITTRLVNYADAWTGLNNKLRLVTASSHKQREAMDAIFKISQRTRTSLEANATLFSRLSLGADDLNFSETELLRVTETLNKQVLIGGNNAQEASAGLVQFAQGIASGRLQGDELRSVMENLLGVQKGLISGFKKLYKEGQIDFKVTKSNIRDLASTGVLSSDLLIKALLAVTDETDAAFSQLDATIAQSIGRVSNSFLKYIGEANDVSKSSRLITGSLNVLADNLDTVINTLATAGVAYGGLKLATYAQVQANKLFATSTLITRTGLAGLGGTITKTVVKTNVLTGSMRALKAAMPFAWAFAALEAATWAFSKSTEESSLTVDKQTKFLNLYQESIEGVTKAQNQKINLDIDIDIQQIRKKLQVAQIAYQQELAEFSKQSPLVDPTGVIFKEQIEMMRLTKIYQGAIIAKEQFLNNQSENLKVDMDQHSAVLKLTTLTDKLTKKRTELQKITEAQITAEKTLAKDLKDSKITLEQYTHGINMMKTEIQNYEDVIEQIAFDKKMEKMAQSMEDSITDSLMNMGQGLDSFKDLATSIFRDIAAEMARVQIAQPLAQAGSNFLKSVVGSMFGAPIEPTTAGGGTAGLPHATFAGGGFTGSGSRSGGVDNQGGFPAILHPNETVIDHSKGQKTGGDTNIIVNYSPQVNALDPRTAATVIAENAPMVVGIIRQAFNRNGQSVAI